MLGVPSAWRLPGFTEIRELGSGASGRVVMARREEDGRLVAIKYLSEELLSDGAFLARFRQEALLLELIDSPQIARLYQYIETAQGTAMVMELVDGVSLRALIRSHGPTGPEAALVVLKGALLGLAAAHNAGVVHRDFKPENVIVTEGGTSKLVDFGIAGRVGEGKMVGTPPYMAPEQWAGAPATPATDVYAATVVFFECLTGTRPFRARHIAALAHEHQTARPPIHEIPPPLQGLVERGMAKLPSQRPPSAQAFIDELEDIAARAYGPDWEHRGYRRLASLAGLLALHFPQAELIPHGHTTLGETLLDGGHTHTTVSRTGVKIALGIGCVFLLGTVGVTLVNINDLAIQPQKAIAGPITPLHAPAPSTLDAPDPVDTLPAAEPPITTEPAEPEPEEPTPTWLPETPSIRTYSPREDPPKFVDTRLGVVDFRRREGETLTPSPTPTPIPTAAPDDLAEEPTTVVTVLPQLPEKDDVPLRSSRPMTPRPTSSPPPTVSSCNPCVR